MGNLTQIIELYETKGVQAVLEEDRLWNNLEDLKQELESKSPEEKEKLEKRFQALLRDLVHNQQEMSSEMQESADRMDISQKNTEACINYTKTSIGPKTGRKKG